MWLEIGRGVARDWEGCGYRLGGVWLEIGKGVARDMEGCG